MALRWPRRSAGPPPPRLVRVAIALHQPEAEMLAQMLGDAGIPVLVRRATFDVPDMLAAGPRALMVPEDRLAEARAVLGDDGG